MYVEILFLGTMIFLFEFLKDKKNWKRDLKRLVYFVIVVSFINFILNLILDSIG